MLDMLEKYLNVPVDFIEIRAIDHSRTDIIAQAGELKRVVSGSSVAASVRVLDKKTWGFSATNDLSKLREAVNLAMKLSKVSQKKSFKSELSAERANSDEIATKAKMDPRDYSLEQKAKDTLEMNKEMKIKKVVDYTIGYGDMIESRYYVNSEGTKLKVNYTISDIQFKAVAKDKTTQFATYNDGGCYGYEIVDKFWDKAQETAKKAVELLGAEIIKSGRYDIVLGPRMAGILAHEAVGHACEADLVMTGESILKDKIKRRIGSELVTICDNPTIPHSYGYYPYDDEGVKSRKTMLIKNGFVNAYLHSRETASELDSKSTGNARTMGAYYEPIVRMSNTYFESGDAKYADIIDLPYGVYLEKSRGGQVDTSKGVFQFGAEGYLIEKGEPTKPLRDLSFVGNILDVMKTVDLVGKEPPELHGGGNCGKGMQRVRVSLGGPYMRVRGARIGGT